MDTARLPGGVAHTLSRMRGIWHEYIDIFDPAGRPLGEDAHSGSPGSSPYERLVNIDFDGATYVQTNVSCAGRPLEVRTFRAAMRDEVLVFERLGPEAPEHVGVSAGPGAIVFCAREIDGASRRYSEPDFIALDGPGRRTRTTVLWRDGVLRRTLRAEGVQLSTRADRRVSFDPRGVDGGVHDRPAATRVFVATEKDATTADADGAMETSR
jgi:hypothetical protein